MSVLANRFFGRRKILTPEPNITRDNVVAVLNSVLETHLINVTEEDYLYRYRRGDQPIAEREKLVRADIINKVCINTAEQIVTFKNGYFMTRPAFYVSRKEEEQTTEEVKTLNEYLRLSGKHTADNEVIDWFHTVGVGVLYVEPNEDNDKPVSAYALDPRSAFVVYSTKPGQPPVMGVEITIINQEAVARVFTKDTVYTLSAPYAGNVNVDGYNAVPLEMTTINGIQENRLGEIPIIEYCYNSSRMGAFECGLSIMDSINLVESNRIDGIEQMVQSIIVTTNVDFADPNVTANDIARKGMINLTSKGDLPADFKILTADLNQTQTQTTLDDLYSQLLEKCGVPSTNRGNASTSDNVGAVYLRSGWETADTYARNCEDLFKASNNYFDRIFLKILKTKTSLVDKVGINDIELKISRNDTSNLIAKTQAALNMKQLGFAPEIVFSRTELSNDPLNDIEKSKKYIDVLWNVETEQVPDNGSETVSEV